MKYQVIKDEDYEELQLHDGTFMLYDHVLRNGGKFIHNEGSWGNPKEEAGCRRITLDDMQTMCIHGDQNCRITEFGKKIITVWPKGEKPFFLCGYHSFEHALIERFTIKGEIIRNQLTDFAHP